MTQTATALDVPTLKTIYLDAAAQAASLDAEVAERRKSVDEAIDAMNQAFNAINAELLVDLEKAARAAQDAENDLRSAAISHYNTTGQKSLDENLGVQVRTKLVYDTADAVKWAETNAPIFIQKSVDKKAFEKVAENLDFVTVEQNVSAVIKGLK